MRISTLQALVAGSAIFANPGAVRVIAEFEEAHKCGRVRKETRRLLLRVLHSTRALDTALQLFVAHHGIPAGRSLGAYLQALETYKHSTLSLLPGSDRLRYQTDIVDKRNVYIHEAGAFPVNEREIAVLLGDMHLCLQQVFGL